MAQLVTFCVYYIRNEIEQVYIQTAFGSLWRSFTSEIHSSLTLQLQFSISHKRSPNIMKYIFLVIGVMILIQICSGGNNKDQMWEAFKRKYNKVYRSAHEEFSRRKIYLTNRKAIDEFNALNAAGGRFERLHENELADMEHKEISNPLLTKTLKKRRAALPVYHRTRDVRRYPRAVDWRDEGVVTPVERQGICSSCWAFTAAGALESKIAITTKTLEPLSKQQLVDCAGSEGAGGCAGGSIAEAYEYIMKSNGLMSQRDYPYENKNGFCRADRSRAHSTLDSYKRIAPEELSLQEVVAYEGPVAASIATDDPAWRFHHGDGIYNNPNCSRTVDHGVLIVGYGTDEVGNDYWIVKNSYGTEFGENGYIKMARNKDNQCGIADWAYIPVAVRVNRNTHVVHLP
uniref:Digestive cysteine proteinase 2 n=1 Tax=Lygus hesperus TaxID=30085 RepID=A0A0A9X307_LYGHE